MQGTVYFSEKQRIRNPLIWIFLIIVNCIIIYIILKNISPSGNSEEIWVPAVAIGMLILSTLLIYMMSLETEIRSDGIYFRFYPFQLKFNGISKEHINSIFLRKYNPIKEYGGWGYRVSVTGKGKALNVSGNDGIQIIYNNNKKLLIGTRKPEDAEMILKQWYSDIVKPQQV